MGDDDCVEGGWIFAGLAHAAEEFAAAKAGIDQDSRIAAGDNRAVALGSRRQYREPHHEVRITREPVHLRGSRLTVKEHPLNRGGLWKLCGVGTWPTYAGNRSI